MYAGYCYSAHGACWWQHPHCAPTPPNSTHTNIHVSPQHDSLYWAGSTTPHHTTQMSTCTGQATLHHTTQMSTCTGQAPLHHTTQMSTCRSVQVCGTPHIPSDNASVAATRRSPKTDLQQAEHLDYTSTTHIHHMQLCSSMPACAIRHARLQPHEHNPHTYKHDSHTQQKQTTNTLPHSKQLTSSGSHLTGSRPGCPAPCTVPTTPLRGGAKPGQCSCARHSTLQRHWH